MAIATTIASASPENIPNVDTASRDESVDPMLTRRNNGNSGSSHQEQPSSSTMQPTVMNQPEQIQSKNTFSLEFPVLLLFFSWNLSGTVFQNQVLYQTCMLTYNYTICSRLTDKEIDEVWMLTNKQKSTTFVPLYLLKVKLFRKFSNFRTGFRGKTGNICIENIYGSSCFGKYHSSIHKCIDWTMVR